MGTREQPRRPVSGIVMLFTGEGWGKSASAFGYLLRARGSGWPATVVQFMKGGAWNPAEISLAGRLGITWPVLSTELTWATGDPAELCAEAWRRATAALTAPGPSLVVLDELTHVLDSGWIDTAAVVAGIRDRTPECSVIVTGRTSTPELVEVADTVTDFGLVKHDRRKGILAP